MGILRTTRTKVFHAFKIAPRQYKTSSLGKTQKALERIHTTPKEQHAIIQLLKQAIDRSVQRNHYGNSTSYSKDSHNHSLMKQAETILGKKRANHFFELANDPYF